MFHRDMPHDRRHPIGRQDFAIILRREKPRDWLFTGIIFGPAHGRGLRQIMNHRLTGRIRKYAEKGNHADIASPPIDNRSAPPSPREILSEDSAALKHALVIHPQDAVRLPPR